MMLCDVKKKYLIDGTPYLGKNSNTSGLPLDNKLILVSYKSKKSKMVYLISNNGTIAESTGKPDIVEYYNSTKGAIDAFDEMSSNMSSSRKTQSWPLCIFYGMINSILVNSYVSYVHNMVK